MTVITPNTLGASPRPDHPYVARDGHSVCRRFTRLTVVQERSEPVRERIGLDRIGIRAGRSRGVCAFAAVGHLSTLRQKDG